jgi:hypothetical protein
MANKIYTCPNCKTDIEYDESDDLYVIVFEHDNKCLKAKPYLPAVYEASSGEMVAPNLRMAAIKYALKVGLRPELGHICLYHGKPWVTIDGWFYRLRKKYHSAHVYTRPLTKEERELLQLDKDIQAWQAEVYDSPKGNVLAIGYGYARSGDKPLALKSAVEPNWPWRLAEKRAEEDAIRKAVPLDIEENSPPGSPDKKVPKN